LAHPADGACWIADHQGMVGDIFRHDGTGADEGVLADGVTADDGAVGAKGCAFLNEGGSCLIHFPDFCSGVVDVGKNHRGATEYAVFEGDAFIDGDVVLNFAFVADDCVRSNT